MNLEIVKIKTTIEIKSSQLRNITKHCNELSAKMRSMQDEINICRDNVIELELNNSDNKKEKKELRKRGTQLIVKLEKYIEYYNEMEEETNCIIKELKAAQKELANV